MRPPVLLSEALDHETQQSRSVQGVCQHSHHSCSHFAFLGHSHDIVSWDAFGEASAPVDGVNAPDTTHAACRERREDEPAAAIRHIRGSPASAFE